eukprot:g3951.t1
MISIRPPSGDDSEVYSCTWTCADAVTTTSAPEADAAIGPVVSGNSGFDDDWLLKIPAYATAVGLFGSLVMVLFAMWGLSFASTALSSTPFLSDGPLPQTCIAIIAIAQQICFFLRTRAAKESRNEDLMTFGSSFDFFAFGTESPLREHEVKDEGGYLEFTNGTSFRRLDSVPALMSYRYEPKSQFYDNLFWIGILLATLFVLRLVSYVHHGTFDTFQNTPSRRSASIFSALASLFVFPRIELFVLMIACPSIAENASAVLGNMYDDLDMQSLILACAALLSVGMFVIGVFYALVRNIGVERRCAVIKGKWKDYEERSAVSRDSYTNLTFWESHHSLSTSPPTAVATRGEDRVTINADDTGIPEVDLVSVRVDGASKTRDTLDALHPSLSMIAMNVPSPRSKKEMQLNQDKQSLLKDRARSSSGESKRAISDEYVLRYGNLGFVNFREKMYAFSCFQLSYFVVFGFIVGFAGSDAALGEKGQLWALLIVEIFDGALQILLLPRLHWSRSYLMFLLSFSGVIFLLEVLLKIACCILLFGLIPDTEIGESLGANDAASLLIVVLCALLLLKLFPLLIDHVFIPLFTKPSSKDAKLVPQASVLGLEMTTKKARPTSGDLITFVLIDNAGTLTKSRSGARGAFDDDSAYDFNETLLQVLGEVDERACGRNVMTKYVV